MGIERRGSDLSTFHGKGVQEPAPVGKKDKAEDPVKSAVGKKGGKTKGLLNFNPGKIYFSFE